jgi:hypothetical protein
MEVADTTIHIGCVLVWTEERKTSDLRVSFVVIVAPQNCTNNATPVLHREAVLFSPASSYICTTLGR